MSKITDNATKLMDLKVDFAFKQVFGKIGNEAILSSFLNAALGLPKAHQITNVKILNPEILREHEEDKASFLDIYAEIETGDHVNIEIQLTNKHDMEKRTLHYWSRIYTSQLGKGEAYAELPKTITINIINFRFLKETEKYHTTFHLYKFTLWSCLSS